MKVSESNEHIDLIKKIKKWLIHNVDKIEHSLVFYGLPDERNKPFK